MQPERSSATEVGPVLIAGRVADAIVAAIRKQNPGVRVSSRGSYLRVSVPDRCAFHGREVEHILGDRFRLPQDLERVMPSFRGRMALSEDVASWQASTSGERREALPTGASGGTGDQSARQRATSPDDK
jgi:toluene monooxygenase system protein D